MTLFIPLAEMMDVAQERQRLQKELTSLLQEQQRLQNTLDNVDFINKAPAAVVEKTVPG